MSVMNSQPETTSDEEIDLLELLALFWRRKWFIVAVTSLFAAGGVAYALLAQQWWRAEVVMTQVDSKQVSGGLAQLGGLASLAGINIGAGGGSQNSVAVLKSKDFAREFIEEKNLLPVLMAERLDAKPAVDIRDAVDYFDKDVRAIVEDKKSGLITLSITWTDPVLATEWANELVKRANQRLRAQALQESERNIKYLQGEIAATNVTAVQQAIGKVIESEMQKLLLARGSEEFAFKVIDKAVEPKKRAKPQRAMIAIGATLAGGFLSLVLVLIGNWWSQEKLRPKDAAVSV